MFRKTRGLDPALTAISSKISIDLNKNRFIPAESSCYLCFHIIPSIARDLFLFFSFTNNLHTWCEVKMLREYIHIKQKRKKNIDFCTDTWYNLPYIAKKVTTHICKERWWKVLTLKVSEHTATSIQFCGASLHWSQWNYLW